MEKGKSESKSTLISTNNEVTFFKRSLWIINLLYYQILGVITWIFFWISFKAYDLSSTRLWHVVLSTVAYIPLMAVAIITFSKYNLPTLFISRSNKYTIHGVLLFISCAAVTVGIAVETDAKRKRGSSHFVSNHAILGLVSWILIFISTLIGLIAANTRTFSSYIKPILAKLIHNFLGLTAFALGIASLLEMWSLIERNTSTMVHDATLVGVCFVTIFSCLEALVTLFHQIKGAF